MLQNNLQSTKSSVIKQIIFELGRVVFPVYPNTVISSLHGSGGIQLKIRPTLPSDSLFTGRSAYGAMFTLQYSIILVIILN